MQQLERCTATKFCCLWRWVEFCCTCCTRAAPSGGKDSNWSSSRVTDRSQNPPKCTSNIIKPLTDCQNKEKRARRYKSCRFLSSTYESNTTSCWGEVFYVASWIPPFQSTRDDRDQINLRDGGLIHELLHVSALVVYPCTDTRQIGCGKQNSGEAACVYWTESPLTKRGF